TGERPDHLVGTVETVVEESGVFEILITQEMLDYLADYVTWCNMQPGVHFTETRVDFSDVTPLPNQKGTSDHAACTPGRLVVTDLKYGKGVQVFAKDNTQAILYAYGFFKLHDWLFDFQEIEIRIGQPRFDHWDTWTISREELLEWVQWLRTRAYEAWRLNAPRTPGDKQCQFCKIKGSCMAYAVMVERSLDGMFDNLDDTVTVEQMEDVANRLDDGSFAFPMDPGAVGRLTIEQKMTLSKYAPLVTKWFDAIAEDIAAEVKKGVKVPGKKLVEGRSSRVFKNDEVAAEHLMFLGLDEDVVRPRTMIGITAAETQLQKCGYKRKHLPALLKGVVFKPPGRPIVVDEDDPRPAITDMTGSAFENLDEQEL
ncbi:MAG: DUF2800 domain-containing protein, partial [Rhodanobacter sp.]